MSSLKKTGKNIAKTTINLQKFFEKNIQILRVLISVYFYLDHFIKFIDLKYIFQIRNNSSKIDENHIQVDP